MYSSHRIYAQEEGCLVLASIQHTMVDRKVRLVQGCGDMRFVEKRSVPWMLAVPVESLIQPKHHAPAH
jgi:hypothetical protein